MSTNPLSLGRGSGSSRKLIITDKFGNPVDFPERKSSSSSTSPTTTNITADRGTAFNAKNAASVSAEKVGRDVEFSISDKSCHVCYQYPILGWCHYESTKYYCNRCAEICSGQEKGFGKFQGCKSRCEKYVWLCVMRFLTNVFLNS